MHMEDIRKGDFIRLKDLDRWQINRISGKKLNVFEISNIEPEYVEVNNCKEKIPISEIEPIPINGRDDSKIYYDPIVAASIVFPGDTIPIYRKDYSYYYDSFKRYFFQSKNFQELVKEQDLQYVHQVQHFLIDKLHDDGLKIDAI
jgi:hypothetical protein